MAGNRKEAARKGWETRRAKGGSPQKDNPPKKKGVRHAAIIHPMPGAARSYGGSGSGAGGSWKPDMLNNRKGMKRKLTSAAPTGQQRVRPGHANPQQPIDLSKPPRSNRKKK